MPVRYFGVEEQTEEFLRHPLSTIEAFTDEQRAKELANIRSHVKSKAAMFDMEAQHCQQRLVKEQRHQQVHTDLNCSMIVFSYPQSNSNNVPVLCLVIHSFQPRIMEEDEVRNWNCPSKLAMIIHSRQPMSHIDISMVMAMGIIEKKGKEHAVRVNEEYEDSR